MIKNIWFILGPGGARMDFVAGWISNTFGNFIKYQWSIDASNGKSWIFPMPYKHVDHDDNITFDEIVKQCQDEFKYSPDTTIVFPCHGFKLKEKLNQHHFKKYNFKFIKINYSESNIPFIIWEGLIKNNYSTELSNPLFKRAINGERLIHDYHVPWKTFLVQENLLNQSLSYIKQFGYEIISLDFDEVIKTDGSYHILEKLNLPPVRVENHDFYNRNLRQSFSPESVTINNNEFNKKEFMKKFLLEKEEFNNVNQ